MVPGGVEDGGQGQAGVGHEQQRVGGAGQLHGLLREGQRPSGVAAASGCFGPHPAPGDRRLQVGPGQRLGLRRDLVGLIHPVLQKQGAAEERRCLGGLAAEPPVAEAFVGATEELLGGGRVSREELDEPGHHLRLELAVGQAEALHGPP